ncbi:MAG: hypothetical protein JXR86_09920 [Spirochaetales bacterium]|nr:hypothetical protein [Spirochaetales bacterium]
MKKLLFFTSALLLGILFYSCSTPTDTTVTLKNISVDPLSISGLQVTDSVSVTVTANYSDGTTENVTGNAEFSDNSVVKVSSDGILKAMSVGSALVVVQYDGKVTTISVSTVDNSTGISLDYGTDFDSLEIGDSVALTVELIHGDGSTSVLADDDGLTFEPEAFAYSDGKLKVLDGGSDSITVSVLGHSETINLPGPVPAYSFSTRRAVSPETLSLRAVSYSGYREGQSPNTQTYPSEDEIAQDLGLLKQAGFGFLRLYDSGVHARRTLNVIKNSYPDDFKVMLGVWIQDSAPEENILQADTAIGFATGDYADIITAISIGNECTVYWNTWAPAAPATVRQFVQYVRSNVTQPVTTDDNFSPYTGASPRSLEVAQVIDYLAIHTYPALDTAYALVNDPTWKCLDTPEAERAAAMNDWAVARAKDEYNQVRTAMDNSGLTALPIVIGETGWKHMVGSENLMYNRAHPVNAAMYYNSMVDWVYGSERSTNPDPAAAALEGPMAIFYFEAFDEPWKGGDDGWGLFDKDRQANYAIYSQPGSTFTAKAGENFTLADAVYMTE